MKRRYDIEQKLFARPDWRQVPLDVQTIALKEIVQEWEFAEQKMQSPANIYCQSWNDSWEFEIFTAKLEYRIAYIKIEKDLSVEKRWRA